MRLSAICLGAFLLESTLSTAACRREARPPEQPKSPQATLQATPAQPKPAPPPTGEVVTQVMQKGLPSSRFLIDPEGKYAGEDVQALGKKCDV